jgi:hypothetical protein
MKQHVEATTAKLLPQSVTRPKAGALVHSDKLDAVDETHEARFGLTYDPRQLRCRPHML